ncbi:MAG: adenosylcobinamide amidohydrolase [Candidatus Binataceae bacterium]|nr:adenosylcobinamide amidohydrolase [Candidatus Binataceae bacterium]
MPPFKSRAGRARAGRCGPWRWTIADRTLAVWLPAPYLALGWAPLGGGLGPADLIVNHQIEMGDRAATEAPGAYLWRVVGELERHEGAAKLQHEANGPHRAIGARDADGARRAVAMMTGAEIARAGVAAMRRGGLIAAAWCTAGCSNALRAGDRATAGAPAVGTINLIVTINRPLNGAAMAEAIQIATEARVIAVQAAGVVSVVSGKPATGTGTDCITMAAPAPDRENRDGTIVYCGKHTVAGELIARAVMRSCAIALRRAARPGAL